ncbi:MAG: YciI family protein [Rhodospirillaceae bacterium]|jgi:uncharacterized protein|nr:YciI family protein [Rhodospirillaceae bacterium]
MLFAIYCIDKPGMAEKRVAVMQPHRDYLAQVSVKIVMSGPLVDDDGETVVGSLYVVEAADRAEIEAFQKDDPLVLADLWELVEVRAFLKRVDNRD